MPNYQYLARDESRRIQRGLLEASSPDNLRTTLQARGLRLVRLQEEVTRLTPAQWVARYLNPFQYLPPRSIEIELMFAQMAVMLRSGVSLSDGDQFSAIPPNAPFPGGATNTRPIPDSLGITGTVPGSLTFQVIDENFRFRMQLLESKNRVTALATPLILTANNEVSRIFVGDTLPFTVGFTPGGIVGGGVGVGGVASTPITELRDVGQSLLITPNINADRTVTLRIVEENSDRVVSGAAIPVPSTDGDTINNVPVDTVSRRIVSGTVVAQDGMAVALGGLIEESVIDRRDQLPILGDIPHIGFLFRRQATYRLRSELIVMIRPYIFNTPDEASCRAQCFVAEHTLHPNGANPRGTMDTFLPCEVIRPDPECASRARLLRLHNVVPKIY